MQTKGKTLHTTRYGGFFCLCNGLKRTLGNRNHADASTFGQRCVSIEYKRIVVGLGLTQGDELVGAGYKDRHIVCDRVNTGIGLDALVAVKGLKRDCADTNGLLGDQVHLTCVGQRCARQTERGGLAHKIIDLIDNVDGVGLGLAVLEGRDFDLVVVDGDLDAVFLGIVIGTLTVLARTSNITILNNF